MQIITIAAAKGGAGKTTISSLLAVRAARDRRVGMIDLNRDQATLSQWWMDRGEPDNPRLIEIKGKLISELAQLRARGDLDLIVIDTPPIEMQLIEAAVMAADLVVVPVKTSMFDVDATEVVQELCTRHGRAFVFLLSDVDRNFKKLRESTHEALATRGTVLEHVVTHRAPYMNAPTAGKTGAEINDAAATETDSLWDEIVTHLGGANEHRKRA